MVGSRRRGGKELRRLERRLTGFGSRLASRMGHGLRVARAVISAVRETRRHAGEREKEPRAAESAPHAPTPGVADERTIRRTAERQDHGLSTEELRARWAGGLNPGGTHGRAVNLAPDGDRDEPWDEPDDPKMRRPGHDRHMPATRRGS
jgi:hypothetical protein